MIAALGRWLRRQDRGSVSLELAILLPALLLYIDWGIVSGRTSVAQSAIEVAAHDAARAASLARTAPAAHTAAENAATQSLDGQGLACAPMTVTVDTSQFALPVGQPASAAVTVTCVVSFADLPAGPPTRLLSATFVSPLDQYRSRS